jgi:hypothetical protein
MKTSAAGRARAHNQIQCWHESKDCTRLQDIACIPASNKLHASNAAAECTFVLATRLAETAKKLSVVEAASFCDARGAPVGREPFEHANFI